MFSSQPKSAKREMYGCTAKFQYSAQAPSISCSAVFKTLLIKTKPSMKKITHLLITLLLTSGMALTFLSCNGDKQKLADKEKELQELRQLAELDKREMENQYAEFANKMAN